MLKKNIIKHEKIIEEVRAAKTNALVRARRGELWIEEHQHTYNEMMADYVEIIDMVKKMIRYKKNPFWINVIAQFIAFLNNPIAYILNRKKARKHALDSYWEMKKIKKEWDDDFKFTNKRIDEDYYFVEESEKFIKEHTAILNNAKKALSKKLKRKNKND
jgi:hypothetical protein